MYGTSMRENREIPPSPRLLITGWAAQGTQGGTPEMYEGGKSDGPVVPANLPNKAAGAVAEVGVLTVVGFADEAFIENADVHSGVGRRGDGVFVTVTLIGVSPGAVGVACSAR